MYVSVKQPLKHLWLSMYENNRKLTANATFTRNISGRYQNFYYMTDYHCK